MTNPDYYPGTCKCEKCGTTHTILYANHSSVWPPFQVVEVQSDHSPVFVPVEEAIITKLAAYFKSEIEDAEAFGWSGDPMNFKSWLEDLSNRVIEIIKKKGGE